MYSNCFRAYIGSKAAEVVADQMTWRPRPRQQRKKTDYDQRILNCTKNLWQVIPHRSKKTVTVALHEKRYYRYLFVN